MAGATIQRVRELETIILAAKEKQKLLYHFEELSKLEITKEVLKVTNLLRTTNCFQKFNDEVGFAAKKLVHKWKNIDEKASENTFETLNAYWLYDFENIYEKYSLPQNKDLFSVGKRINNQDSEISTCESCTSKPNDKYCTSCFELNFYDLVHQRKHAVHAPCKKEDDRIKVSSIAEEARCEKKSAKKRQIDSNNNLNEHIEKKFKIDKNSSWLYGFDKLYNECTWPGTKNLFNLGKRIDEKNECNQEDDTQTLVCNDCVTKPNKEYCLQCFELNYFTYVKSKLVKQTNNL